MVAFYAPLTPERARARVESIKSRSEKLGRDDEALHVEEDTLWRDALVAIRDGAEDPAALAAIVLETESADFGRWTG